MSKKIIAVFLFAIMLAFNIGSCAYAGVNILNGFCSDCGGITTYICQGQVVYSEVGTHTYNWGQSTCAVDYRFCYHDFGCVACGLIEEYYVGRHECIEHHYNCGTGSYKICRCYDLPIGGF